MQRFSRKQEKFGNEHLLSLFCATLSRLAYFNDNKFYLQYRQIMGPVFLPDMMSSLNTTTNMFALLDDQSIFNLSDPESKYANFTYTYNDKKYIDFLKLNIPQNINIINDETKTGSYRFPLGPGSKANNDEVQYISIAWSAYGEIYVVADKRMPNTIMVIFRGTYSTDTALLYTHPSSIVSLQICPTTNEKFLYGIFKPSIELIHTIIETIQYLAVNFLKQTEPDSVRILTTGHSLGGAMATNFAYIWQKVKANSVYNEAPYNIVTSKIVCVSLGSPRCMGSEVAKQFCDFVEQKQILYLRVTTRGDPVTGMPFKSGNFQHPCSQNSEMRKQVLEDCNAQLTMRPKVGVNYVGNLDCQSENTGLYGKNFLSHTVYLDILFTSAVNIPEFLHSTVKTKEILKATDGSMIVRLIWMSNMEYKNIFFNLNETKVATISQKGGSLNFREILSQPLIETALVPKENESTTTTTTTTMNTETKTIPNESLPDASNSIKQTPKLLYGAVNEDVKVTEEAYKKLISQMVNIIGDLNPQKGKMASSNTFDDQTMPSIGCTKLLQQNMQTGGRKRKTRKTMKSRKRYKKKTKRRQKKRTKH